MLCSRSTLDRVEHLEEVRGQIVVTETRAVGRLPRRHCVREDRGSDRRRVIADLHGSSPSCVPGSSHDSATVGVRQPSRTLATPAEAAA